MEDLIYKDAKILVVDDIEEVLKSTKNCLKFEGMNVECISNPIEALEYLKNNKVDVLLLDFFMPQMNGDKFIENLREFNNETIIILRTGYSDKVPPLEIIDSLNIQGYIDKLKGDDELVLMTKSAIKTSFLYKKLMEQQRQINLLEYRNEFFGKFLYRLLGEIRERAMTIGGLSAVMAEDIENIKVEDSKRYAKEINEAIGRLQEVAKTLEVEELGMISVSRLNAILNDLFELDLKVKNVKLDFKYSDDVLIRCDSKIVIYIMVELIEYLIRSNSNIVDIECDGNIEFNVSGQFSDEVIEKVTQIANKSNENITVTTNGLNIIINIG